MFKHITQTTDMCKWVTVSNLWAGWYINGRFLKIHPAAAVTDMVGLKCGVYGSHPPIKRVGYLLNRVVDVTLGPL